MARTPSPLKWHGGKHYLAARIVALMPPHTHYVEPFAGGLAVLLAKDPEGVSEVVNDVDGDLVNFWACLRDGLAFGIMRRQLQAMPFSEADWKAAGCPDEAEGYWARSPRAPVDQAIAFFVRVRQSMAGRRQSFAPLSRTRTRRGMNERGGRLAVGRRGAAGRSRAAQAGRHPQPQRPRRDRSGGHARHPVLLRPSLSARHPDRPRRVRP
jgi:hypothetical protein